MIDAFDDALHLGIVLFSWFRWFESCTAFVGVCGTDCGDGFDAVDDFCRLTRATRCFCGG